MTGLKAISFNLVRNFIYSNLKQPGVSYFNLKKSSFSILILFFCCAASAQNRLSVYASRSVALSAQQDSMIGALKKAGINEVPVGMYLRSFKYEHTLEIWIKPTVTSVYKLFRSYDVCKQSGTIGPKRVEGDYQVPEGFYYINEFNANSEFHLSLGLNYPNASDRILSDPVRPGSAIYVHGNCVSVGCIPLTDRYIEEVYVLANLVKQKGEMDFIPVHIFPIRYGNHKSAEYLESLIKQNPSLATFNNNIRQVYDYFELKKSLPIIMVNKKGDYVLN